MAYLAHAMGLEVCVRPGAETNHAPSMLQRV
jgi:hypothetical protein